MLDGYLEIFVVGDLVVISQVDGKLVLGVVFVVKQMGKYVVVIICVWLEGKFMLGFFVYQDVGNLVMIGCMVVIVYLGRLQLFGVFVWWFWLVVYVFFLIGFCNCIVVLFNWVVVYWSYQCSVWIIFGDDCDD